MSFAVEFYENGDVMEPKKVWATSGGWEVEVSWDMIDALRNIKVDPVTKISSCIGSPRYLFDTEMYDAMQVEADRYGRDDE
jgi:hypothetical protein